MSTVSQNQIVATYQGPLKVWTVEREEWCISSTAEGAADAYENEIGHRLGEHGEHVMPFSGGRGPKEATWTEEPADYVFTFVNEDDTTTAKTCAEWATTRPAGYFASANV